MSSNRFDFLQQQKAQNKAAIKKRHSGHKRICTLAAHICLYSLLWDTAWSEQRDRTRIRRQRHLLADGTIYRFTWMALSRPGWSRSNHFTANWAGAVTLQRGEQRREENISTVTDFPSLPPRGRKLWNWRRINHNPIWFPKCRCHSGFGPHQTWSGRTKSAGGYRPRGTKSASGFGPLPRIWTPTPQGFGEPGNGVVDSPWASGRRIWSGSRGCTAGGAASRGWSSPSCTPRICRWRNLSIAPSSGTTECGQSLESNPQQISYLDRVQPDRHRAFLYRALDLESAVTA